ncbi:MAG: nitrous oxide-stimulated promoter family protein [bacterium]
MTACGVVEVQQKGKREEVDRDILLLSNFVEIYCRRNHKKNEKILFPTGSGTALPRRRRPLKLCAECAELLRYGIRRRELCPYDPKPMCKRCETHCYRPAYRQRVKTVMKFSGIYLIKRGRLDMAIHYFL